MERFFRATYPLTIWALLGLLLATAPALGRSAKRAPGNDAAAEAPSEAPQSEGEKPTPSHTPVPEEADVQKIKEKYWARGNEAELGVVQNRLFSKNRKIELGLTVGSLAGDPFLKTTTLSLSGGYHFTEFFSLHALVAKAFVSPSSALKALQDQLGTTANTNEPKLYLSTEARASVLYGKVSLLGAAIMYFDAYFSGGVGYISTESGGNPLFSFGIGQQIHLTRTYAINLAYKILWYPETILGKVGGPNGNLGQNLGSHGNLSDSISVGLSILLDPLPEEKKR